MKRVIVIMMFCIMSVTAYARQLLLDPPATSLPGPARTQLPKPHATQWGGVYAGINAGYGWAHASTRLIPLRLNSFIQIHPPTLAFDSNGAVFGFQVGYDWQLGADQRYLAGIETDFDGSTLQGSALQTALIKTDGLPYPVVNSFSTTEKIDGFGTVRPVFGILMDQNQSLLYLTGGFAYAYLEDSANTNLKPFLAATLPASLSCFDLGWTAGGGAEWKWDDHLSAGIQYLHLDFDSLKATANETHVEGVPVAHLGMNETQLFNMRYQWFNSMNIVRLNLNYHF